jgi:hypothetical protein
MKKHPIVHQIDSLCQMHGIELFSSFERFNYKPYMENTLCIPEAEPEYVPSKVIKETFITVIMKQSTIEEG